MSIVQIAYSKKEVEAIIKAHVRSEHNIKNCDVVWFEDDAKRVVVESVTEQPRSFVNPFSSEDS